MNDVPSLIGQIFNNNGKEKAVYIHTIFFRNYWVKNLVSYREGRVSNEKA